MARCACACRPSALCRACSRIPAQSAARLHAHTHTQPSRTAQSRTTLPALARARTNTAQSHLLPACLKLGLDVGAGALEGGLRHVALLLGTSRRRLGRLDGLGSGGLPVEEGIAPW